jgi:hypothetical protein
MEERKKLAREIDDAGWVMSSQEVVGVENEYWAQLRELG